MARLFDDSFVAEDVAVVVCPGWFELVAFDGADDVIPSITRRN